jgi:hypothetical protein
MTNKYTTIKDCNLALTISRIKQNLHLLIHAIQKGDDKKAENNTKNRKYIKPP